MIDKKLAIMGQIQIGSQTMSYTDLETILNEQLSVDQFQVLILGLVEQGSKRDPNFSSKLQAMLEAHY